MSDPETSPAPLETRRARDRVVRFDPTVTMGALMQIGVVVTACVAAYGTYSADKAKQAMEVDQIKADASVQRTQMKEQIGELRGDVKDVQRQLSQIDKSLSLIQQQQQQPNVGGRRSP